MKKYKVLEEFTGALVGLQEVGLPRFVELNDKTDQKCLEWLHKQQHPGVELVTDKK
jgi:hypothetical protein